jgi:hypothetical protein
MYTITSLRWLNQAQTLIEAVTEEAGVVLYNPSRPEWPDVSARQDIATYVPPQVSPAQVKAEASRRILEAFPLWKQMNMNARSNELFRIQAGYMRDSDNTFQPARALTSEETAEEVALREAWDWVKAVRAASNTIEAMNPIPQDYTADARWP